MSRAVFPFSAIVGQEDMKLAMLIAAVDQGIGGVLVFGDRGTGKSTTVRALAALLPPMEVMQLCRYGCDPAAPDAWCLDCRTAGKGKAVIAPVPVVDLPLGATEDRVVGALDLERALAGSKVFEPGLLARANRGFLYIDEVNLLEDHLVSVEVRTPNDLPTRIEVIRRRDTFDRDPTAFAETWRKPQDKLRRAIVAARACLPSVTVTDSILESSARLCMALGTDGLRGELTLIRAGRAVAALDGDDEVAVSHLRRVAPMVLSHRLRRNPLDEAVASTRVNRAVEELLGL